MSKNLFGAPRQSCKKTLFMVIWGKQGVKHWYLGTFGAKRRRKIFSTILVRKIWILDLWDGGLGGGCFRARPLGGGVVWDTPPTTPPPLGLPIEAWERGMKTHIAQWGLKTAI